MLTLLFEIARATTIAGVVYKEGVVLGSDERATEGALIADPRCRKIHQLSPRIWAAGAGVSADAAQVCRHVRLDLKRENFKAVRGLVKRRIKDCALIVGGYDDGPQLFSCDGAVHDVPFAVLGSGSLAAAATLEMAYMNGPMDKEAAILAVKNAILNGIRFDTMSGGRVNILVIDKDGASFFISS